MPYCYFLLPFVIKTFILSILSGDFTQVLLYSWRYQKVKTLLSLFFFFFFFFLFVFLFFFKCSKNVAKLNRAKYSNSSRLCADSPEPPLLENVISTKIRYAGLLNSFLRGTFCETCHLHIALVINVNKTATNNNNTDYLPCEWCWQQIK